MRRLLPDPAELDDAGLVDAYRVPAGRHLRVNFIASLDGAVTVDGRSGGSGSPGDRRIFHVLRALADVVLVGHGTASAEGYGPVTADSAVGRLRAALGRPATAPIAVVSQAGVARPGEPAGHRRGRPDDPGHLRRRPTPDAGRRWPPPGAIVLVCGDDDVDLPLALDRLAALGHEQVLCEGGPTLFRDALAARTWSTSWTCRSHRLSWAASTGCSSGLPDVGPAGPAPDCSSEDGDPVQPATPSRPGGPVAHTRGPAHGLHRLLDGQEHRRLDSDERATTAKREGDGRHRDVVRSLAEREAVELAEGVPETVQRAVDGLDVGRAASLRPVGLLAPVAPASGV